MDLERTLQGLQQHAYFPARTLLILTQRNPRLAREVCDEAIELLLSDVSVERVEVAALLMTIRDGAEGKSRRAKSDKYLRERTLHDLSKI